MAAVDVELKSPYTAPTHLVRDVLAVLSAEYRVTDLRRGRTKCYHQVHLDGSPAASEYEVRDLTNDEGERPSPKVGGEQELLLKFQTGVPEDDEEAMVALLSGEFSVERSHSHDQATYYSVW